jgi:hypothetical protein
MSTPNLLMDRLADVAGRVPVPSPRHQRPTRQSLLLAARLREAESRVSRGKLIVARQREIVAAIDEPLVPFAAELLDTYEVTLALFEERFAVLQRNAAR